MNFIFISPNFPHTYWNFCDRLKKNGVNVLGIGDCPYDELVLWKSKSAMKPAYKEAGIPTARNHKITDIDAAKEFLREIGGYPVIVKPDVGVGAANTWKLENDDDLVDFFNKKPDVPYVMEEFVFGNIYSYDAICDSKGEPLFENSCWFPPSVADMVNKGLELRYYSLAQVPEQLQDYGRRALKAFKVRSRFVHFEFFRLTQARKNLGEVGEFVGLEVNMRPAGGYTPDMMDFGHSTDVYQIYADMVTSDKRLLPAAGEDKYCVYAATKDIHQHAHSRQDILDKYGERIVMAERMPDVLSGAMGNEMYTAIVDSEEEVNEFADYVQEKA